MEKEVESGREEVAAVADVRKLQPMLIAAIDANARDDGWAALGGVGSHISKMDPAFDARNYGFKKLSELARSLKYLEVKELPMARPDGVTVVHVQIQRKGVGQKIGLQPAFLANLRAVQGKGFGGVDGSEFGGVRRRQSGSVPELHRHQAFFLGIQQYNLNNGAVLGIADVGVSILRDLTNDRLVRNTDLQDIVVFKVNTFHGVGS